MEVYCQWTESNLRLCSILSSILGRSRNHHKSSLFDKAIINKQQLLVDTNNNNNNTKGRQLLLLNNNGAGDDDADDDDVVIIQIILIGYYFRRRKHHPTETTDNDNNDNDDDDLLEFLSQWISRFALRYNLQVCYINLAAADDDDADGDNKNSELEHVGETNDDHDGYCYDDQNRRIKGTRRRRRPLRNENKSFEQRLESTIDRCRINNNINNTESKDHQHHHVILVGLDQAGTESIYNYLKPSTTKTTTSIPNINNQQRILGVVLIHPTILPFFWTIPLFVVLQQQQQHNPSTSSSSSSLSSSLLGIELQKSLMNPNIISVLSPYNKSGTSIRSDSSSALWLVRLIAKYSEGAYIVYKKHHSYHENQQISSPPPSTNVRSRL